jgi:hypothetical protein
MTRKACLIAMFLTGLAGCGGAERIPDAVPIRGQVTFPDGRPVKDVMLTLQPLDSGHMAGLKVGGDGKFNGSAVPGKYAYFFGPQESKAEAEQHKFEAALKTVPEKYKTANMEHTVSVNPDGELCIQLQ